MSSQPTGVIILGMHRSGTSAATRLVNMLGLATCRADDMRRGPWNPTGYWESQTLVRLDDRLLGEMGRTWWYPPPSGDAYFEAAARITTSTAKARRVFRRVHRERPWVWKDPRNCLLLPFWRAALDGPLVAILIMRNPLEVADSLQRRHDLPDRFGAALWERYNRLALAHAGGMPVLVSRYDDLVTEPAQWCERARDFLAEMGLQVHKAPPAEDIERFVAPERRHSIHTRFEVAAEAAGALATLEALEALVGPHASFEPPRLPSELASVEAELTLVGPDKKLVWHPPPWAGQAGKGTSNSIQGPRNSSKIRKLRRLLRKRSPARWLRR